MYYEPWLRKEGFTMALPWLPNSFNVDQALGPLIQQVGETWFESLIGADKAKELTNLLYVEGPHPESTANAIDYAGKFLGHAVWSRYVLNGNVLWTESGPVFNETKSDPISDEQRAMMSRDAKALAESYGLKLLKVLQDDACRAPGVGTRNGSFRTIRGRKRSRFD